MDTTEYTYASSIQYETYLKSHFTSDRFTGAEMFVKMLALAHSRVPVYLRSECALKSDEVQVVFYQCTRMWLVSVFVPNV